MIDLIRKYNVSINSIILDTPDYLDVSYAPDLLKNKAIEIIETIEPRNGMEKTFMRDCKMLWLEIFIVTKKANI